MIKSDIFNRVYLASAIEEAVLQLYLDCVCREITNRYGTKYTAGEGEIPLHPAYENALVQGICYHHTKEDAYLKAYQLATEAAFLAVWRERQKGVVNHARSEYFGS